MENDNQLSMFKGGLALGVGVGLVGGVMSTLWIKKRQRLNADAVLTLHGGHHPLRRRQNRLLRIFSRC